MTNALFLGWDRPQPGKEGMALELLSTAKTYFDKMKRKGVVRDYEAVLLSAHGGNLNGFILVRLQEDKISQLRNDEEFQRLITKSVVVLKDYGVVDAFEGGAVERQLGLYRESI